ncbi:MAG: response regulator transcription factor [Mediterranea sp.]|jgi:DNA-binding NarL/FixJ family response regulator|nr:response regulator transcription factor [Mediterranea sp.]
MKNSETIKVAIAETSVIIRSGLTSVLKRLPNVRVQPIEILTVEALHECLRTQNLDMLIVNPSFGDYFDVPKFRTEMSNRRIRLIALVTSYVDTTLLSKYDASIFIFDNLDALAGKIAGLIDAPEETEEENENQDALSQREKEIVVCVVKGMTNKEIAESLFLSIHTVITHRRNISKKLQIHSAAGLTIYAIVNKLVALSDVKDL